MQESNLHVMSQSHPYQPLYESAIIKYDILQKPYETTVRIKYFKIGTATGIRTQMNGLEGRDPIQLNDNRKCIKTKSLFQLWHFLKAYCQD